jgi:RNA polymerase sigma-70 factor (ECF subfamily)
MEANEMVLRMPLPWATAASDADWETLYADQLPRVYNFFRYRVGAGPEAEDLTATTFEKAWRARHQYRRDLAAFSTWLFTIARHVAVDHHRRTREHVPLEHIATLTAAETADAVAEHRSDVTRLARLLAVLPERERELLALKYGAGLTNRAIARLTGLSESNVGTLLHRTVQQLRSDW